MNPAGRMGLAIQVRRSIFYRFNPSGRLFLEPAIGRLSICVRNGSQVGVKNRVNSLSPSIFKKKENPKNDCAFFKTFT
jgi:hypothetical protein